ncbi:MAG: serine/threonine-protein kinase [Planctomycetota bacterium]
MLSPDHLRQVLRTRQAEGSNEPLAQDLVEQGVIPPRVAASLLRDLAKGSFGCSDCKRRFSYDELATIPRPGCTARCPTQLDISAVGSGSGAHPRYANEAEATVVDRRKAQGGGPALWRQLSGLPSGPIANTHVDSSWETEATLIERKPKREERVDETERRQPSRRRPATTHAGGHPTHAGGHPTHAGGHPTHAGGHPTHAGGHPTHAGGSKKKSLKDSEETVRDATVLRLPSEERQLGPYELISELGRGANGVIYLAQRPGLARRFAVKTLRPDSPQDEETIRRFQLEAAAASKVNDPGIVSVFDVGQHKGRWYYAMEYCPGRTLEERLQGGPLLIREAVEVVRALARTMHNAHRQGVIHRDLKPANIILEEIRGRPRVTDFGVARDRTLLSSCTAEGIVLGTPNYMAPEQLLGNHEVGPQSDVYSLGVILYECLTGQRPYRANSPVELARQFTEKLLPPSPSVMRPELPKRLEEVSLRALALDPGQRYRSAAALADDLDAFLGVKSVSRVVTQGAWRWVMIGLGLALGVGSSLLVTQLVTGGGSEISSEEELSALRQQLLTYRPRPNLGQLDDALFQLNHAAPAEGSAQLRELQTLYEERRALEDAVRVAEQATAWELASRALFEAMPPPGSALEAMHRVESARVALAWGVPARSREWTRTAVQGSTGRLEHERVLLHALGRWLEGERALVGSELEALGRAGEDLPCKVAKALYLLMSPDMAREAHLVDLTLDQAEGLGEPDYLPLRFALALNRERNARTDDVLQLTAGEPVHPLLAIVRARQTCLSAGLSEEQGLRLREDVARRAAPGVAYEIDLALATRLHSFGQSGHKLELLGKLEDAIREGLSDAQRARAAVWVALYVNDAQVASDLFRRAKELSAPAVRWEGDQLRRDASPRQNTFQRLDAER